MLADAAKDNSTCWELEVYFHRSESENVRACEADFLMRARAVAIADDDDEFVPVALAIALSAMRAVTRLLIYG